MKRNLEMTRGMRDSLPEEMILWRYAEGKLGNILNSYGYSEIRFPVVEPTTLFSRSIGQGTDVGGEMYNFVDRGGRSLTLRPEGTVCCARFGVRNGLLRNQERRFWYSGPMFRYERPQWGRYRQFHQVGAEVFGRSGPDVDAELMMMTARCWRELGIEEYATLQINSGGSSETQDSYRGVLLDFLEGYASRLGADYHRYVHGDPMRFLDSRNGELQDLLEKAPTIDSYLDDHSREHFAQLCDLLDAAQIRYRINPRLVRGLNYYTRTVFEWTTDRLGAQNSLCGGGRYDGLVEKLGGHPTPAVGFAIGLERVILLMKLRNSRPPIPMSIYLAIRGHRTKVAAVRLVEDLRDEFPQLRLISSYGEDSPEKQLREADRCGSHLILTMEEDLRTDRQITLKDRGTNTQEILRQDEILPKIRSILQTRVDRSRPAPERQISDAG